MRKLHLFSTLVALSLATTTHWATAPTGAIDGVFSVSATKKAYISKGNLQYQASTNTWRFALHQYDYVGDAYNGNVYENEVKCNNKLIADDYTGWIDLFGWGTGNAPTKHTYDNGDYSSWNEWGENNISNGGGASQGWRTMTAIEYNYLYNSRTGNRYAKAVVNGVRGVIFLPNDWNTSYYTLKGYNSPSSYFNDNNISAADWTILEEKGAIFMPCGGIRQPGNSIQRIDEGQYWTSKEYEFSTGSAIGYSWNNSSVGSAGGYSDKYQGRTVRLIKYCPAAVITEAPNAKTLYEGPTQALVTAGEAAGGIMYYKNGSGPWSTSIPTGTDAGNYSIYYKAVGDATHNDSEEYGPIIVTILPPPASIGTLPTAKSPLIYTGGELELVNAGSDVTGGTLKYSLDGVNWSEDIPTASALGDYTVYWKVEGDASHSDYIPEPAYIAVSITIPTVSDNADPSTVLSNLYNNGNPSQLLVERTIYRNGEYNTICLPFALDATQLAASPLNGFNNLKTIKGASISGTAPDLSIDIFVEDVTAMEAGKPYLISYPSANENIVNPVFSGITVSTTEPGNVEADGVTFQGMFAQVHIDPYDAGHTQDYLFLGANSQLMWPLSTETSESVKMRGFRAYFIIDRNAIPAQVAPRGTHARFVNAPKQPTAIENTELNTKVQKLLENGQLIILKNGIKYNAQGQVLK